MPVAEALPGVSQAQGHRSKGAFLSLTGRGEECAFGVFLAVTTYKSRCGNIDTFSAWFPAESVHFCKM